MSENYLIQGETLTEIADAVRDINGETEQYTPAEIAGKIRKVKTVIDQLEESKIIATATGESIVLTDSSDKPLEGLVLYGKTTQDGTPSPTNPIPLVSVGDGGELNVQACGKNLLDCRGLSETTYAGITYTPVYDADGNLLYINATGTATATSFFNVLNYSDNIYGSDYVLNGCKGGANTSYRLSLLYYTSDKTLVKSYQTYDASISLDDTYPLMRIQIRIESGFTASDLKFYPMIHLASITDATYEPYKESQTLTVQTPNGLPGIPVTSGGNYTDENGQQYMCDEKDYGRLVYVQRVNKRTLTGNDPVNGGVNPEGTFYITAHDALKKNDAIILLSHYLGRAVFYNKLNDTEAALYQDINNSYPNQNWIYFRDNRFTAASEFKSWLAEMYSAGNPVEIIYPLATPIETPLSAEEIAAYKAVHTNKPNTTILNDGGAGMSVSYVADTKAYIDNKFAALEAAILSTGGNV